MNILVVAGHCLRVNSSANLCHLSYINGLLDCGHQVDLLTVSEKDQVIDQSIVIPPLHQITEFDAAIYERLGGRKQMRAARTPSAPNTQTPTKAPSRSGLVGSIKAGIRKIYGPHGTSVAWYHKAKRFHSDTCYDLVISLSDPPVSHKLTAWLMKKDHLKAKRWVQIWGDPWYADIYGHSHTPEVWKEECELLRLGQRIMYVSPLTLMYQKQAFPEHADKMEWMPLPSYYQAAQTEVSFDHLTYGYFGDYATQTRNLKPFYEAARELGADVAICGNSNSPLASTDSIQVYPRLPLSELKKHEDRTNVLIFLCNLRGGQIPGKIYQYAATNKLVLFIMDGTPEEQQALREYFMQFERFVFCENRKESIAVTLQKLQSLTSDPRLHTPLSHFEPKQIITKIIESSLNHEK